ncbi:hypothetical protein HPB52_004221 [Rhipicephalus sanguineus]|uniref:Secreted protein n=1 Tax=Rhipicephalus sanguineus TaxID=34632 RepID=A0A9D4PKN6_RHISA|nr:hypothetical protein HPB52_004221 [Rhipicephalus sanguineus]
MWDCWAEICALSAEFSFANFLTCASDDTSDAGGPRCQASDFGALLRGVYWMTGTLEGSRVVEKMKNGLEGDGERLLEVPLWDGLRWVFDVGS